MKNSSLNASTPLHTYGSGPSPSGNPHTNVMPGSFQKPTQANLTSGGVGHFQNKEVRNPVNGIPHISMAP